MKRVSIICSDFVPNSSNGIVRHCLSLVNLFAGDDDLELSIIKDIKSKYLSFIRKFYFNFKDLRRKISDSRSDIIHIHGFADLTVIQTIIAAKLQKKKIVYSPHYHPIQYLQHPWLGWIFFHCCLRPILPFVSSIVTISNTDTEFFKRYHKCVIKIPHYYDSRIKVLKLNYEKKQNMVLFVGRNEENKGITYLYSLPEKYDVHCVTDGILKRSDFTIHHNLSDEELSALYMKASLVVVPSRYEAFSYAALEAFAHSTPVVMSDRVKIADYLVGLSGYSVFKYGDTSDFLQKVDATIGKKVDTENILNQFNKSDVKLKYKRVYERLLVANQ